MATPKRRSARLSSRGTPQRSAKSKILDAPSLLGALIERDETPDMKVQSSIDDVLSTPATNVSVQSKIAQLSKLKTPTTEPRPTREQMHPHTIHQTTAKAPDSGLKLGFGNPPSSDRNSIAIMQNTPSKAPFILGDAKGNMKSPYEFKFRAASHLSNEAQLLMDNLRDEAARIKEQMRAEKLSQDEKDAEIENQFEGFGAAGRKIAKPKGKAGRFSDVHMADFKKMDSIADHASSYRSNKTPRFAQPTTQSLKRSPSKAGLDELARPQTAGKGTPVRRPPPSRLPNQRGASVSQFKSLLKLPKEGASSGPAKHQRQSEFGDVSTARLSENLPEKSILSTLPRPMTSSGVPHSLLSPTNSSLLRSSSSRTLNAAPSKPSASPRIVSTKTLQIPRPITGISPKRTADEAHDTVQISPSEINKCSTSKIPRAENAVLNRPLPPLPTSQPQTSTKSAKLSLQRSDLTKNLASPSKGQNMASRLPMFAGLKSILRPSRPQGLQAQESSDRIGTPKQLNAAHTSGSARKVDFTPSVKSRYAVKLAAESPSPAKIHQDSPRPTAVMFEPTDYTTDNETVDDEDWDDAEEYVQAVHEITYPKLPDSSPAQQNKLPSIQTVEAFMQKAKEISRRESLDFKSIIAKGVHTSCESPFSVAAFNTNVSKASSTIIANTVMKSPGSVSKPSPSTIRRVRASDANETVTPFEEPGKLLSHGLEAKKRRHDVEKIEDQEDSKENQRPPGTRAKVPGSWEDSILEDDEGEKRGGKRVRVEKSEELTVSPQKKPNPAREAAAKAAKDRKKGGILSLSRLNMLARPKGR